MDAESPCASSLESGKGLDLPLKKQWNGKEIIALVPGDDAGTKAAAEDSRTGEAQQKQGLYPAFYGGKDVRTQPFSADIPHGSSVYRSCF